MSSSSSSYNSNAVAGPSRVSSVGSTVPPSQAYPQRTFTTQLLYTDDEPISFSAGAWTTATKEPLYRARVSSCGQRTRESLAQASSALHSSIPVAFPTETVYGLAANALCERACKAIFDAKGRPQDNPLIVHVSDMYMAQSITQKGWTAPLVYQVLMHRFWPGGITFLVPASRPDAAAEGAAAAADQEKEDVPPAHPHPPFVGKGTSHLPMMVTANHPLVGIRMPSHPLARALIAQTQLPLAAPSANASGRPSPTTAQHVMYDLGGALDQQRQGGGRPSPSSASTTPPPLPGRIPYILDGGPCHNGVESTVVDGVTSPGELRILRPGAVSPEEIQSCLDAVSASAPTPLALPQLRVYGRDLARQSSFEAAPTTPGMKYRHYSPTAPVILLVAKKRRDGGGGGTNAQSWKEIIAAQQQQQQQQQQPQGLHGQVAPCHPLRIGIMSLVDSPLAREIFEDGSAVGSELDSTRKWLQSQRSQQQTQRQVRNGAGNTEMLGRCEDADDADDDVNALGPAYPVVPHTTSTAPTLIHPYSLGTLSNPALAARRLFAGLRLLDEGCQRTDTPPVDVIFIESLADTGIGLAVMNRVAKAAGAVVHIAVE